MGRTTRRARLSAGIDPRLVPFTIPDVNSQAFVRQAHLQSRAVARSPQEAEDQAFVDAITQWPPDEFDE